MSNIISGARVDDISRAIAAATADAMMANADATEAREAASGAANEARSARERLMGNLANASVLDGWTTGEVDAAIRVVPQLRNDDKKSAKTLATMLSEVKLAANPLVRGKFARYQAARDTVFAEEGEDKVIAKRLNADHDDLLARTFSRSYQALVAGLRAVIEGTTFDLTTPAGWVAFARSRDPRNDPDALAKKIAGIAGDIREMLCHLPVKSGLLIDVASALETVNSDTFKALFTPANAAPVDAGGDVPEQRDADDGEGEGDAGDAGEGAGPNDPAAEVAPTYAPATVVNDVPRLPMAVATPVTDIDAMMGGF